MHSKVLLVFAILVLAVSFAPESEAFTAGGGGNIPRGAKREYEVRFRIFFMSFPRAIFLDVTYYADLIRVACNEFGFWFYDRQPGTF